MTFLKGDKSFREILTVLYFHTDLHPLVRNVNGDLINY